jgi:hypothetical protein
MPPKSRVKSYDVLKVKNFLILETMLYIHELQEQSSDESHQRALTIYKAKVSSYLESKRPEEMYNEGITADLLMQSNRNTPIDGLNFFYDPIIYFHFILILRFSLMASIYRLNYLE